MRNATATDFLECVFEELDAAAVRYCVERNYEQYPDNITGDVDLVVCSASFPTAVEAIGRAAKRNNWQVFIEYTSTQAVHIGFFADIYPERFCLVIELFNGQIGIRYGRNQMIGNANHATKETGVKNVPRMGSATSPTVDVANQLGRGLDVGELKKVMADRRVCKQINLLSVVFVPDENKMHLACGCKPAAHSEFKTYTLFKQTKRPAKRATDAAVGSSP